jgi:YesN/AraC family two-component response regulator
VDYLLKPLDRARLRVTINRAQERLEKANLRLDAAERVDATAANVNATAANYEETTKPARLNFIPVVAEGKILMQTTTQKESYTISYRLKDLEAPLIATFR